MKYYRLISLKRILLLFTYLCVGNAILAQSNNCKLKFEDEIAKYKVFSDDIEWGKNEEQGEGLKFQFERWKQKMQGQIDQNGFIVPFSKTVKEWQKYLAKQSSSLEKTTSSANWILAGPTVSATNYSYLGRINTVAFDPIDSNTFYVGTPAGSTWKTTDGGHTWASLYDNLPSLGVADIKVNPRNRNTIYVVTGDFDGFDSYSAGVIVSYNGGATWNSTGLSWTIGYNRASSLLINPIDTNSMMLATDIGLYKSHNAGISWNIVDSNEFNQILYNPSDTNIVYGATYSNGDFTSWGSHQIMRSHNGGTTWDSVTHFTNLYRINLAVCPANPAIVKAIVCSSYGLQGVYGSSDSGLTYVSLDAGNAFCTNNLLGWQTTLPTTSCNNQGMYDLCIAINPANPDDVVIGGVYTWYSSDGGVTWQIANESDSLTGATHVHVDKHCLIYSPLSGALFEASDGGIHKNYSPLFGEWIDLTNGLSITEFYHLAIDNGVPFCLGGSQDNGTLLLNGTVVTNIMGYDGYNCLFNYGDPAHVFYTSNQFGLYITRDAGLTETCIYNGGFPRFALHPHDTATLVLGGEIIYASYNNGSTWMPISPIWDSFGLISHLAISVNNPNYIYAIDNGGAHVIHYTTNFGVTWDTTSTFPISYPNYYITDLVIDPKNEKHFWITINGVSSLKVLSYDLTTNLWTDESGTLPNISVKCMVIDTSSLTKYIGTQAGVFFKTIAMSDWALYDDHLPAVCVMDLKINYTTSEIWAATLGRGIWRSKKNEVNKVPLQKFIAESISVLPNPSHGFFIISTTSIDLINREVWVKLIGTDGKIVMNMRCAFDNNGNMKIITKELPAGFYICEVDNKNLMARCKVAIY